MADAFIMGGYDGTSDYVFAMYRPDINEWWQFSDSFTTALTTPAKLAFAWFYNDTLYVAGGTDASNVPTTDDLQSIPLPTLWRDSTYAPSWTNHGGITIMPSNGWGKGGTAIGSGNVFLFGGEDADPSPNETNASIHTSLASLPTLSWSSGPTLATDANVLTNDGAIIGTTLYRGGGATGAGNETDAFESIDLSNIAGGFTSLAVIPNELYGHVMVTDGTYVYVMGGYDGTAEANTSNVQRYDPGGNSWVSVTDLPAASQRRVGYFQGGKLWYFQTEATVYTYDVSQGAGGSWVTLSAPTNPDGVSFTLRWGRVFGDGTDTFTIGTTETQGPFDPVRADARMDALSVSRNFNAPPVDVSVSQSFLPEPLETISPTLFTAFDELLTPGTDEFFYLPLGRQSREYLQEFTGETILARMSRTYPASIMVRAQDVTDSVISANLDSDNNVNARYVIEYVLKQWATNYAWFSYATVPDVRMPIVGGESHTYGTTDGVLPTPGIFIDQDTDNPRSMLDITQELLAPFGAYKTVNDQGQFVIRARYGPDADASGSPAVTLKDNDLYLLSTGDPSLAGTKNRVTVTTTPYDRSTDTAVMQDAYFQLRDFLFNLSDADMITDRTLDPPDAIPGSRLDLTGGEGTSANVGYGRGAPMFWPAASGVFPDEEISWEDSGATLQLDVDFYAYYVSNSSLDITKNLVDSEVTLTYSNLPVDGTWVDNLMTATYTNTGILIGTSTMWVTLGGRWVNEPERGRGIELRVTQYKLLDLGMNKGGTDYFGYWAGTFAFTLSDASTAWTARGARISVTYGILTDTSHWIDAADGGNAIEDSQDALGIIEEVIDISPYAPGLEAMTDMAEGLLYDKMRPRKVVIGEQSVVRAFPVRFEHVGRLVELPDATEGTVVSRSYREASPFVGADGDVASSIEVLVLDSAAAGAVDTTNEYILRENAAFLELEAGSGYLLMEESP